MSLGQTDAINPQGTLSTGAFTSDNRLVRTDRPTSNNRRLQQTGITVDDSDNITGVVAMTTTGLATLATVDINGGNVDGTTIGATTAAAATITTLTVNTAGVLAATVAIKSAAQNTYNDLIGGTTGGTDPRIRGYGSTHATLANRWEYAATTHAWYAANGTSLRATLASGAMTLASGIGLVGGASAVDFAIKHAAQDIRTYIMGGTTLGTDPAVLLYGSAHASVPGQIHNRAATHYWYAVNGSTVYGSCGSAGITANVPLVSAAFLRIAYKSELTIAGGAIAATGSYHFVDNEGDAASDDLDTISGGTVGDILVIRPANGARTVVAKDGTGNLALAGDFSMDAATDTLTLIFDGTNWLELSRSDNGT